MFIIGKFFDKLKTNRFRENKVMQTTLDIVEIAIDTCILLVVFYLLFDLRLVPTSSMYPNVVPGDRVFFQKPSVYVKDINRGDVIMFDATPIAEETGESTIGISFFRKIFNFGDSSDKVDYLKRVIAVGGDNVYIKKGSIYINGKKSIEKYKIMRDSYSSQKKFIVPKGYVFVMGDNRPDSYDGRYWGENLKKNDSGFKRVLGDITVVSVNRIKAKAIFEFGTGGGKFHIRRL